MVESAALSMFMVTSYWPVIEIYFTYDIYIQLLTKLHDVCAGHGDGGCGLNLLHGGGDAGDLLAAHRDLHPRHVHRVPALGRGLPAPGLAVSEVRQVVGGDGPGQTGEQTCRRWLTMLGIYITPIYICVFVDS